jgi:MFS family permease
MVLAVPAGRLADRVGRARVFVGGYVLLLATYALLLLAPLGGGATVVLVLVLLGAYYASTDGVLAAAGSAVLPEHTRGTGLALLSTFTSLGRLGGSLLFGALWAFGGASVALAAFAAALALALALASFVLRRSEASAV